MKISYIYVALFLILSNAAVCVVDAAPLFTSETKILASDPSSSAQFGYPVAISGNTIVTGSKGAAYVFVQSSSGWVQQQKIPVSSGGFNVSVAIDGDTILLGNPADGLTGAAYVYTRTAGMWVETQKLIPSSPGSGQEFGVTVSLSGDTMVIGAIGDSTLGYLSGAAYVFVRTAGGWIEQQKLIGSDTKEFDEFGLSVAINGDTIVVGTPLVSDSITHSGAAYVFQRLGGAWFQQQKLVAPDPTTDERFASAIAVDADTVVVGAYGHPDAGFTYAGTAYVYVRLAGIWTMQQKLTASTPSDYNQFGVAVAVQKDTVVVGSSGFSFPGFVYLFERSAGVWTQRQILQASDATDFSDFGQSLALSTERLVVGATHDDEATTDAGAVYVYEADTKPPTICHIDATPDCLWPPNHRMVPVTINVKAHDDLDPVPVCRIISVSSNEPADGLGDGDTSPDWEITGPLTVNLRAERSGEGHGRIYMVTIECSDDSGNTSTATVTVRVPRHHHHVWPWWWFGEKKHD